MDADRLERIRANADVLVANAKAFQPRKVVEISDDDWHAIEVLREEDHGVHQCGRVKRATIKRMDLERKLKAKGISVEEWREMKLPKVVKVVKATLIKK